MKEITRHRSVANLDGSNDESCNSGGGSCSGLGGDSHGGGDDTRNNDAAESNTMEE